MTLSLIAGVLVSLAAVILVSVLRRTPTRIRCPDCGEETQPIRLPGWMRRAVPDVLLRWCPVCGWEGIGRRGADWVPGRSVAHRSGFFWGEARLPPDFGFHFADDPPFKRRPRPSGFLASDAAHPLRPDGFRWKDVG